MNASSLRPLRRPLVRAAGFPLSGGSLALALLLGAAQAAKADLRVCNDTKDPIGVALGLPARDGSEWITQGWWRLRTNTCESLIEGELDRRYYYLYAENGEKGGQWRGDSFLCVAEEAFEIEEASDCFAKGYRPVGFFRVDAQGKTGWTVRLTGKFREGGS